MITTVTEHKCVLDSCRSISRDSCEVTYLTLTLTLTFTITLTLTLTRTRTRTLTLTLTLTLKGQDGDGPHRRESLRLIS